MWDWRRLENLLVFKEIKPPNPKGKKPWVFIGRTDYEAEAPKLWPSDEKNWLTGKDPDSGKVWSREEKKMTEDENGWIASLTQWTWVWVNSGRWGRTGRFGMEWKRVGHDWATKQQQTQSLDTAFKNNMTRYTKVRMTAGEMCYAVKSYLPKN